MKQLIYLSSAAYLFNGDELAEILTVSRVNNRRSDLTGLLLYSHGTFIQVLEGPEEKVNTTFERILHDERHKNIITLINITTLQRDFSEWSMGFTALNADKYNELEGYLKSPGNKLDQRQNSTAVSVLKTFIKTNQLVIS